MRILLPQSYKTEIRGNKDEKKKKKDCGRSGTLCLTP